MKLSNFAYRIWKKLETISERNFLLAVSGGRDSMALLAVFAEIKKSKNIELSVAHIFHGPSDDPVQVEFRKKARKLVQKTCERFDIPFFTNSEEGPWPKSQSEDSLRQFRREWFLKIKDETNAELIVQAHHEKDLLETRLIRLIRGTGTSGLVAMKEKINFWYRPFLFVAPEIIAQYSVTQNIEWLDDPSNKNLNYLRNWLRCEWLPMLEAKRKGATESLARSLQLLSDDISETRSEKKASQDFSQGIERAQLRQLGHEEKRKIVAAYMQQSGLRNYRLKQVDEIIKRLNTQQNRFEFSLASHLWRVDKNHIYIVR